MKVSLKGSFLIVLFLFSAIGTGVWLAGYSVRSATKNASFLIENGPWRTNATMDLKNSRQRALVALVGLFALRETEVLYFTANIDSNGHPLTSEYEYVIEGTPPDARYWSYTLYGEDDFLIPNPDDIYGYNQQSIETLSEDNINPEWVNQFQPAYRMTISSQPRHENWLPSGDNESLVITLRLYNPAPSVYEHLSTYPLPTIRRINE